MHYVRVWYAPEDLKPGQKIHEEIEKAIHIFDKVLIVLSENSMESEWVKTEIRNAKAREIEKERRILFPICITSFENIKKWKLFYSDTGKDLAVDIREYLILNFSKWKEKKKFDNRVVR